MPSAFIPHRLPLSSSPPRACPHPHTPPICAVRLNPAPATAYAAYMTHLFVLPPTPPTPAIALSEATNLSLNFAYLIPTFFPTLTPANHPCLEAIFHIVVAWALLLAGFLSDSVTTSLSDHSTAHHSRLPAAPFLLAAAFLTNIFYLPYLALRKPNPPPFGPVPRTPLLTFAESPALPIFCVALLILSLLWGALARPEFGDLLTRFNTFRQLVHHDILAYSFVVDVLVFSVFQAWMVADDANRREWTHPKIMRTAVRGASVPFVGLAAYLFVRARHAPIRWAEHP